MVKLTRELGTKIALAYDVLPIVPTGERMKGRIEDMYWQFALETERQYKTLPVRAIPDAADPYKCSADLFGDIERTGTMRVYSGGNPHPVLSGIDNWRFRAVHDYYGHHLGRNKFDAIGELNATRDHARMYSESSLPILVTETLGQNCWVNFHPAHCDRPARERPYAVQKAGLLPRELWEGLVQE